MLLSAIASVSGLEAVMENQIDLTQKRTASWHAFSQKVLTDVFCRHLVAVVERHTSTTSTTLHLGSVNSSPTEVAVEITIDLNLLNSVSVCVQIL